jgi:hypothetical protein
MTYGDDDTVYTYGTDGTLRGILRVYTRVVANVPTRVSHRQLAHYDLVERSAKIPMRVCPPSTVRVCVCVRAQK